MRPAKLVTNKLLTIFETKLQRDERGTYILSYNRVCLQRLLGSTTANVKNSCIKPFALNLINVLKWHLLSQRRLGQRTTSLKIKTNLGVWSRREVSLPDRCSPTERLETTLPATSITYLTLWPNCQWSICILCNVDTKFWQGRTMHGIFFLTVHHKSHNVIGV